MTSDILNMINDHIFVVLNTSDGHTESSPSSSSFKSDPEQITWSDILDTESPSSSLSFAVGIVKHVYVSLMMVFPSSYRKHLKNQIDSDYASGNSNQLCIKCRHDCRYKYRYKSRCESKYKYPYKYIYTNTNTIWYSQINCE